MPIDFKPDSQLDFQPEPSASIPGAEAYDTGAIREKKTKPSNYKGLYAIPEVALNLIGGAGAGLIAPIGAGLKSLNDRSSFEKNYADMVTAGSTLGTTLADMFDARSNWGDKANETLGEVINQVGLPMAGFAFPRTAKGVKKDIFRDLKPVEPAPAAAGIVDNLRKTEPTPAPVADLGTQVAKAKYADDRTVERLIRALEQKNQPLDTIAVTKEGEALLPDQAKTRGADLAQRAIEERQRALEQEVAQRTSLDFNAAERARREAAPTGANEAMVDQAAREAQQTYDFVSQLKQDEIDATPYGEPPAQYGFTPEFGRPDVQSDLFGKSEMPIRADLSMEAQNLQEPLQRNLWGDELGPGQGAEKSLTEAIDSMPWAQRRGAIKSQLANDIPVSPDLQAAIDQANRPSGIGPSGSMGSMRGIQRGAIDPALFKQGMKALTKWHSELTNKPWLKEAFPADRYETNPDGTPYVIFHGTIKAFNDRPKTTTSEGLHAGPIVPATIKSMVRKAPYIYGATTKQMQVSPKGSAVYPMVIRKGNYPVMPRDYGNWSPVQLTENKNFAIDLAKATGKGYYDVKEALNSWFEREGTHVAGLDSEAKSFGKFLKSEFNVDGFWYPNEYESVKKSYQENLGLDNPSWSRMDRMVKAAGRVEHPSSFVTYVDDNLRSIFDQPQKQVSGGPQLGNQTGRGLQRGATTFHKDIADVFDNLKKRVLGGTPEDAFLARTIRDDSFLARGEDAKTILEKAKAQEDGPSLWADLQSGPQLAAKKINKQGQESALVDGVARHLAWAEKKGTKDVLERVIPLERYLSKISRKELEVAMDVKMEMQRAALDGRIYTDAELRAAGASEQTITTIKKMQELDAYLLDRVNAGRAAVGKKPVTGQAAYFSSQWTGNWHMPIKDADGNLVGYVRTLTRGEANKAKAWIAKNHPEWIVPDKPEYKKSGHVMDKIGSSVTETYDTLLEAFKGTPMELELQKALERAQEELGYRSNRFDVHLKPKSGVRFFIGDRPWLDKHENAVQAAKSQIDYYKEGLRWSAVQESMKTIKEVLADPELIQKQPNNMDIASAYTQHALGLTEDLSRGLVNYISSKTGFSPAHFGILTNDFKTFTYLVQLSMSAGYMLAAPLQAFLLGPSWHMKLSKEGYQHSAIKTFAQSWLDGTSILKSHVWKELTDKEPTNLKLSNLGEAAKRYMEDNGIIDANLFDDYGNIGEHRAMTSLKNSLGRTISEPEKVARVMTFMSYVHHLADGGHPINIELFKKADDLTNNTLTNFSRNARPLLVDKMGAVGELSYVYKSPAANYYNNLSVFARQAIEGKSVKDAMPLIMAAVIMPSLLGGVMNIPGINELDGVLNLMQKFMANVKPEYYKYVKDLNIREFAMQHLPDAITYGALSAGTGVNMATRFSNQIIDPEKPFSLAAPIRQEITEQKSVLDFLAHPTEHTLAEGIYKNMPPAVRGTMEVTLPIYKAGERDGKTLYRNPYNITEPEAAYARSTPEEALRVGGLVSLPEYRSKEARYTSKKTTGLQKDARDKALEILSDAIIRDDKEDIKKFAKVYFDNYGDEGEFQRVVSRNINRAFMTPMERQVQGAKRLSEIMDLVHHMRLRGEIK